MNPRRRSLALAALAMGMAHPLRAFAQPASAYPKGPVKIIVPQSPGGIVDVAGRLIADQLAQQFKQSFFVENRPGANSTLGTAVLSNASPDGQTILFGTSSIEFMNPYLYKNLSFETADLQKISVVYDSSIALVVPKKLGVKNFKELVAYAKTKGDGMTYGSWGNGSSAHVFGVILENAFGIKLVHVPYKGELAALVDMSRGDLDMTWASPNGARTFQEKGDAVVIAVTGAARSPGLPGVPTFAEQGVDAFKLGLYGVAYAPKGTPPAIVARLQQGISQMLTLPSVRERFATLGLIPVGSTPEAFAALFDRERPVWQKLIAVSGATLD